MLGFIRTGFLFCLFLLMAGCSSESQPPLRIGSNQWLGYEPVYLARDLGYLNEDDIWLVEMRSASQVLELLASDNLDGAMLTLDEALTAVRRGVALQVVAVMDISDGADVLLAKPGISLEGLKGKRVGVENTAVGAILLNGALKAAGLNVKDIEIVSLEVDDHEEAYRQGLVDAVVTFEPTRTRLLKSGARQIFDSSYIPDQIIDVLVVRSDLLGGERDRQISALVEAFFKALDYMQSRPEDAAERIAPRLHISADEVLDSYKGIRLATVEMNYKFLDRGGLDRLAGDLLEIMLDSALIGHRIEYRLANSSYLPDID